MSVLDLDLKPCESIPHQYKLDDEIAITQRPCMPKMMLWCQLGSRRAKTAD
jgi:hypothetical protein